VGAGTTRDDVTRVRPSQNTGTMVEPMTRCRLWPLPEKSCTIAVMRTVEDYRKRAQEAIELAQTARASQRPTLLEITSLDQARG